MTDQELKDIVAAVVAELEKSGVDFDYKAEQAEDDDLVFVIRGTAPNYQGVTVTWKGLLDIITAQATQAKNDAVTAKNTANTILTQVQSKGTEITNFVATSKTEIETQKNESVNAVKSVYQTDLNELKGDLDIERNARIEGDTALSTIIQKVELKSSVNRYEIENLKAKAEGQIYREEIVDANTYKLDIPSSVAPYAEVKRIKGKSVVWSQLEGSSKQNIYSDHYYIYIADAEVLEDETNIYFYMRQVGYTQNNQAVMGPYNIGNHRLYWKTRPSKGTSTKGDYDILVLVGEAIISNKMLIDLTQIFGLGNEPTEEECKKIFSAEYYPFDAGTIRSFPVKTVRSVNAEGTEIGSMDVSSVTSDLKSTIDVSDEWENGKITRRIGSRSYTSGDESDSSVITDGTTTYYPLDTPTEETVPEIDNYINVEGGGTLTFESDDAVHMPVPSTDRFVVDLMTSTEEETT